MTNNTDFESCKNMIWKEVITRFNKMKNKRKDVEFDDLLSEGYMIYSWCLQSYEEKKGSKFTTYLCMNLKGRLRDYYNHTFKEINLYEDSALKNRNPQVDDYETTIKSIEYDLSEETKSIIEDGENELSYEANEVLKYILSREWETKMRRNMPSNAQISKKFGYPSEIVESVMFEIKQFWMNRKAA